MLRYFRVTQFIVFSLSFSQAAICKPRESPEGKRACFLLVQPLVKSYICVSLRTAEQFSERALGCSAGSDSLKMERSWKTWVPREEKSSRPLIMRFFVSGDSFVVNACLARKGIDDWLVKQKYYCASSRLEQRGCHHKNSCGLTARVSTTPSTRFTHLWGNSSQPVRKACKRSRCLHTIGTRLLKCAHQCFSPRQQFYTRLHLTEAEVFLFWCSQSLHKLSQSAVGRQTFNNGGDLGVRVGSLSVCLKWHTELLSCVCPSLFFCFLLHGDKMKRWIRTLLW